MWVTTKSTPSATDGLLVLKFQTKHLGKTIYRNEDEGEDEILYGYPILIIKYNVAGLNARNITSAIVAQ
ncbi:12321_t:CDS:2, partial [Rhizophagus irregularis]